MDLGSYNSRLQWGLTGLHQLLCIPAASWPRGDARSLAHSLMLRNHPHAYAYLLVYNADVAPDSNGTYLYPRNMPLNAASITHPISSYLLRLMLQLSIQQHVGSQLGGLCSALQITTRAGDIGNSRLPISHIILSQLLECTMEFQWGSSRHAELWR